MINEFPEGFDIPSLLEKWLKIGRSTERCDRPKMEKAIRIIYEFGEQTPPETILWADSPFAAAKLIEEISGEPAASIYKTFYSWYFGGSLGATGWVAYYDAARQCGIEYTESQNRALNAMIDLTECGYWLPFEEIAIACEKPIKIEVNAQGELHSENGPAMLFADGYALWAINGTTVKQDIVEHPENITVASVFEETNSEVRRIMCERMGWDKFVTEAQLALVSECPDPGNAPNMLKLYDTPELIEGQRVRLLICTNGTPKPNGVTPIYGITTPIDISDAVEAASWVTGIPVDVYRQIQRRT